MRLALVRQQFSPTGGAENTLAHLAREFTRRGHDVAILAHTWPPGAGQELPGVQWVRVPVWGGRTGRAWSFAHHAARLLTAGRYDLVFSLERILHPHVYRAGDGCHREWLARRWPHAGPGARLALRLSAFHKVMLELEAGLFASPHLRLVIANSRQVQQEIIRHYGLPAEKIPIVYNGLDHRRFSPAAEMWRPAVYRELGLDPAQRFILFVGSGFRRKGLAFLLHGLTHLRRRDYMLAVIGRDRLSPYRRLARRLGVLERVRFLGPQTQVERYYGAAAVVALPTLYDPCSNVVLEALACGRPVITTAANGAAAFITPGSNGAVLPFPEDAPALALALGEYLERAGDPRVGAAATDAVAGLSWDRTAQQTLELLQTAAAY